MPRKPNQPIKGNVYIAATSKENYDKFLNTVKMMIMENIKQDKEISE